MSNIGFQINTSINRPDKEFVEKFRGLPIACISDNMNRLFCMDNGIKPYGRPSICGTAFTVKAPSGDNLMFHRAIDTAEPGDILVISGIGGCDRGFSGEIMVQMAKSRGLEGFVVDGCVRDAEGTAKSGFAVYARGIQANGPYKNGPGMINFPVACGGQVVRPGDILVGDADGIVVIPVEYAEEVLEKASRQAAAEDIKIGDIINSGKMPNRDWIMKTLENGKCDII